MNNYNLTNGYLDDLIKKKIFKEFDEWNKNDFHFLLSLLNHPNYINLALIILVNLKNWILYSNGNFFYPIEKVQKILDKYYLSKDIFEQIKNEENIKLNINKKYKNNIVNTDININEENNIDDGNIMNNDENINNNYINQNLKENYDSIDNLFNFDFNELFNFKNNFKIDTFNFIILIFIFCFVFLFLRIFVSKQYDYRKYEIPIDLNGIKELKGLNNLDSLNGFKGLNEIFNTNILNNEINNNDFLKKLNYDFKDSFIKNILKKIINYIS